MAASKTTDTKADTAARAPKADPEPTADTPTADAVDTPTPEPEPDHVVSDCVVHGGKGLHVGRAVNGKVCSYHAMQYKADGTHR